MFVSKRPPRGGTAHTEPSKPQGGASRAADPESVFLIPKQACAEAAVARDTDLPMVAGEGAGRHAAERLMSDTYEINQRYKRYK